MNRESLIDSDYAYIKQHLVKALQSTLTRMQIVCQSNRALKDGADPREDCLCMSPGTTTLPFASHPHSGSVASVEMVRDMVAEATHTDWQGPTAVPAPGMKDYPTAPNSQLQYPLYRRRACCLYWSSGSQHGS